LENKLRATRLPLNLGPIHFIGIGGIGMSGIAEVLLNLGYSVQGSDLRKSKITLRLSSLGAKIYYSHLKKNLKDASVVIYSSAILRDNVELAYSKEKGLPIVSRAEMLAELMRLKLNVVVAGSHGKTTTTSLAATLIESGDLDPTVINGGIVKAYGSNARLGEGDWMVVEADESDGSFNKLPVTMAIVTNVDKEHLDYYGSFSKLKKAFMNFISSVPFYGLAICCSDDKNLSKIIPEISDRKIITYGFSEKAQIQIKNISFNRGVSRFDIDDTINDIYLRDFRLPMVGEHNVLNACAAILVALQLSVPLKSIKNSLSEFDGVARRFSEVGSHKGALIIDDYAHHPAEISAVIKAARQISKKRVIVVHQPHRFSRLRDLFDEFQQCFDGVDLLGITSVFSAGEKEIKGINSNSLIKEIKKRRKLSPIYIDGEESFDKFLDANCSEGDIFLCLGAGNITSWVNKMQNLKKK
jgi:UDP-N-acetylmuramate--alanine ligase